MSVVGVLTGLIRASQEPEKKREEIRIMNHGCGLPTDVCRNQDITDSRNRKRAIRPFGLRGT